MTSSTRFCLFPLVAAVALLASSTAGVAADVGWTAPVGESSPAASIWLNDTTGATTFSQGILQLNGSADGLAITGQGGATNTGIMSLSGPTAVTRTSTTAGTQSLNFGTITGAGDWQIEGSGKLVVNAQIADTLSDASQITKTGAGSLLITQANTYSGGTTLTEGTLIAGNSRAFASGAIALNGGTFASVDNGSGGPRTFANAITIGNNMTFGDVANTGAVGFSSSVDLQGAVRTFTTSASVTFDGIVSNGGINKVGAASLTMTGINTYAGGTTLTEGTLFAGSNSALGTGDVTLGGSTSPTISSDASGAGSARTFANNVTIKGDVTFGNVSDSGALLFASSAKLGDTGENRAFTVNANTSFGGSISGGAGLTKYGEGTLTLSGSNSYSGGTTFAAGMIRAGNDNAFGTGALTFAGGAIGSADSTSHTFANSVVFLGDMTIGDYIDSMGALTFTSGIDLGNDNRRITTKSNGTFTGVIANGGITKDGLGTLTLSGSNTYSNGTTLLEGTLLAANDSAFGTGVLNLVGGVIGSESGRRTFGNNITMSAGALQFGDADHRDALTFVGLTALDSGEHRWNIVANTDFTGVISGQGASIVKDGDGVLTLANFNSYDGGTNLLAGTVRIANDASLGSGLITFGGGTLASATSDTRTITNNVAFTGNATIGDSASGGSVVFSGAQNNLGNTTRTITSNVATVFSNGLSGSGGLIKSGVGSLTLQGASTYTGDTRVDAGKLVLDGTLASKVVTVGAGAVFGGHGRFDGVISGAGSVDPGNSPGILTVAQVDARSAGSTSFNFEFTQTGAPTWSNAAASGNDVLRITDTVTPFVYALDQSNTVNLYFNASVTSSFTATNYVTLQGGFFTDKSDSNSLASAIAGANFQYYFESSTGSVVYNGHTYSTQAEARSSGLLPSFGQQLSIRTVRVPLANFDSRTSFNGWTMQVISRGTLLIGAVPEIDPVTGVNALSLLAGVFAIAEQRRQRARTRRATSKSDG
jgi:autotransporter-associated beta strand protein